jgi:(p)ppGpp synthase/HD superfamily hydrolase
MKTIKRTIPRIRIGYSPRIFDRPAFERIVQSQLYHEEFQQVMLAYRMAKYGHKQQVRRDNRTRYFDHCKGVALIIALECSVFVGKPLCAGLMHDLAEDSFILTWRDIEKIFGRDIYRALRIVTKERDKDYYWGIASVEPKDWWVILVKLADRLHNIRTLLDNDSAFQQKQLQETEAIYPGLIEVFRTKVPKRFRNLPDYFASELNFACNRVRQQLGLPKTTAFKRAA